MRSSTANLVDALLAISEDFDTHDGVVNACLAETAARLREQRDLIQEAMWLIVNAEPAADVYYDIETRSTWKKERGAWIEKLVHLTSTQPA
jgi:hypothetical protein